MGWGQRPAPPAAFILAPQPRPPVDTRIDVDGTPIILLGTIAGFVPDGRRVQDAFERHNPAVLALGIPPEDLEGLHTLAADPDVDLPDIDPISERLFEWLAPFGDTRIPSPDLDAAFAAATKASTPMEALDMDDEDHTAIYIRANKFRHVLKSGRVQRKLLKQDFSGHADAQSLVLAWDAYQNKLPSLQAVEAAREEHMAERLREIVAATRGEMVLAVVPLARLDGIRSSLENDKAKADIGPL